jgi:hypothetical protein
MTRSRFRWSVPFLPGKSLQSRSWSTETWLIAIIIKTIGNPKGRAASFRTLIPLNFGKRDVFILIGYLIEAPIDGNSRTGS